MSSPSSDPKTTRWLPAILFLAAAMPPALMAWWWASAGDGWQVTFGSLLYWWMLPVGFYAGVCLVWRLRRRTVPFADWLSTHWPGMALAIVATIVVFWLSPPQMRVQFDETCLVGTSQNMQQHRLAVMSTAAVPYKGEAIRIDNMVDKRPPLFAYLVSVAHDVSGYRIENAFLVNGLLLCLGLFLLFAAVRQRAGPIAALMAPVLVLSVPLTAIVATSAGFELLATVLLLATTMTAWSFVDKPSDDRCAVLLGTGMLLAYSRYESVLGLFLLALLVLWCVRGRYRPSLRVAMLMVAYPTLLTPLCFLLQHAQDPNFTPEAVGQPLVAWTHFLDHVGPFFWGWFDARLSNPLPGILCGVGVLLWLSRLCRRQVGRVDLFAIVPVLLTVLVLAWFYGDVREATALRLFLPLAWLSMLPLLALVAVLQSRFRYMPVVWLALAVLLCGLRLRRVADASAFPQLPIASLTTELDRLVARLPGERATTLWVGAPAQHLIVKGHAAVSAKTFQRRRGEIEQLKRQGDLRTIYLLQTPLDQDMAPVLGQPRDLLSRMSSQVVERVGGPMPITVHQLGR